LITPNNDAGFLLSITSSGAIAILMYILFFITSLIIIVTKFYKTL
jgi:hypothetical protein